LDENKKASPIREAGLVSLVFKVSYTFVVFRFQMPMPANPAPSSNKEDGSGTLAGIFVDKRLPVFIPSVVNNTFKELLAKSKTPVAAVMLKVGKVNAPVELNDNGPALRVKQPPVVFPLMQPLAASELSLYVQPVSATGLVFENVTVPTSLISKAAKPLIPVQSPVAPVVLEMPNDKVDPVAVRSKVIP
jgi:hypothetical protein